MSLVATNLAHGSVLLIMHSNNVKYMFCASSPNSHVRGRILIPRSRSKGKGLTFSLSESSNFNRLKASFTGLVQNPSFCLTDPGWKPIPAPTVLTNGRACMISSSNPSSSAKNPHNIAVNVFPDPTAPWHIPVSVRGLHKDVTQIAIWRLSSGSPVSLVSH